MSHTSEFYSAFSIAYSFFNSELFSGKLPECIFTIKKRGNAYGYFCRDQFSERGKEDSDLIDEISINTKYLESRSFQETLSTLVHEMVHLQQQHFGKPSKSAYHNKQWGEMMELVGLIPSDTGSPGGKKTGIRMSHYIVPGGPFETSCTRLLDNGFTMPYIGTREPPRPKAPGQAKYVCPECQLKAYGKRNINLVCGTCNKEMAAEERD